MSISNLTLQYISASFAGLMQYSSSGAIFDGLGNQITLLDVSASAGATAVSGAGTTLPGYPTLTLSSDGAYTIAVNAATTGALSYSPVYKSSSFGVGIGAYLSASVAGAIGSIDGVSLAAGNTILVKDQTAAWQNGVYIIVNSGSVSANYILSRSLNSDEPSELDPQVVIASVGTTNKGIPYGQITRTPIISVDNIYYEQYKANFVTQAPTSVVSKGPQGRTQAEYQIPWWTTVARELDPGTPKLKYVLATTTSNLILTGSLLITGSQIISGGFDVHTNSNAYWSTSFRNVNNGTASLTELQILNGSGVSGSKINIQAYSRAYTSNPNYAGNVLYFISPEDNIGNVNRPVKFITAIIAAPANNNSFEWHHSGSYAIAPSTLKMKLDVPSGILSNSGSIITSGSLTIASGSVNTSIDCALYFGASGSAGSWRLAPEGANLVIQKWNGTNYSGGTTITP